MRRGVIQHIFSQTPSNLISFEQTRFLSSKADLFRANQISFEQSRFLSSKPDFFAEINDFRFICQTDLVLFLEKKKHTNFDQLIENFPMKAYISKCKANLKRQNFQLSEGEYECIPIPSIQDKHIKKSQFDF